MPIDTAEYRRVMGHLVTGVTVVAAWDSELERPCGLTANAVVSVSLDPILVLVCVERSADSHDCIQDADGFSISVLDEGDERLARRFASWDLEEKFEGVAYHTEATGAPVLDDALAWVDCTPWAEYPGGDHTIYVGEVLAADAREGAPLLYYRGGYGRFVP